MNREQWRTPTSEELRLLRRMLAVDFPGAHAYRAQLNGLKVARDTTDALTIFLLPRDTAPSATPAERHGLTFGSYEDLDGTHVELYLVARLGRLRFLDIMKPGLESPVELFPPDDKITVRVAPPPFSLESPRRGRPS